MSMRYAVSLLFVLVALVSPSTVSAQSATVTGKISNSRGKPLVNATVSLGGRISFTDINGTYRLRNVPWGRQVKMQIKRNGKVIKETTVDIQGVLVTRDERVP
jgi:hypothetical protein